MFQGLQDFFSEQNFMPHGHCFLWKPNILWLHVVSDIAIASAYYFIPVVLIYFVRKRKDIPFETIFWLFGSFILLCGTTHLVNVWVLWHPNYGTEGVIKALTGIVSIATFFVIIRLMPDVLKLASPAQLAKLNQELHQNIKERDQAQTALQQAYVEIEKTVEERTAELHKSLEDLARSNAELDDFAYIASHDLKEPLRGLHNHATFLLEDYQDKLDEEGVHKLKRLSSLSERMQHLISNLLYFSQLGRVDLAIQEVNPNEIIADISQMMESYLKDRNATITIVTPLPTIVCDKPRMIEVFRNIITNAVKYNDKPNCQIEIGFLENAESPYGPEKNVFYVKDNGIGIAPMFYKDIFHIFKRLHNSKDEKTTGTGSGLTFVKKIIERHQGHIWVESELGKGTIFYFSVKQKETH